MCAISWSVNSLIVSRMIQALGGGMIMPTTMTIIKRIVPKDKFGSAMGIIGMALLMNPDIGPTVGGYLVEYINWRWIFTTNLPIGVVGILLSYFFLPEISTNEVGKLDISGGVASAIMLFTPSLALSKGVDWGWTSEATVFLFYISEVSLILFIYMELTSKNPLLNVCVFRYTTFAMANILSIITNIALFSGVFFIPLFLKNIRGLGALETGLIMLPGALVSGFIIPISDKLYEILGIRGLIAQSSFVKSLDDIFSLTAYFTVLGLIPAFFLKKTDYSKDDSQRENIIPE